MADLGKQLEMQLALNKALSDRQKILEKQNQLLANQQQLEAALSKHYQDKATNAKDLASNLRDAADETDKAGSGQKDANKTMEQQLSLADRLRNKNKKQGEETDKVTKKNEKQKASWKDLKQAAGKFFDTILNKYPAAAGAIAGLASAMKDVGIAMKGVGNLIGSVVKGAINVGKAILALPFKMISGIAKMQRKMAEEAQPLRDAIEGVRKAFGGLNSEMGSKVMAATKKFSLGAKSAALGGRSLMSIFGYRSAGKAKFVEALTKTMAGLQKLAPMIAKTFSEQQMLDVVGFQTAFELSDEALAGFVKTAGLAGKDVTTALRRAQQAAKSMAKGTGLSTKEVLQGMGEMKADFITFGHLSDEEMAAATVAVKQFGGSIKDLKAVSDKFMNFENAANSLSALNQAFGMQLDAMDMLKAKNPAEQIEKMRQAFFATGRSIEDLNMHEKKMLQQQTNLSDAMLQSAFSAHNQGKSFKEMQEQAEKDKKKKLDQTKVLKELADALAKFTGLGQDIQGVGDGLGKGFTRAISLHPAMRSLMKTTRGFLLEVRRLGIDLGNVFMDMLADTGIISSLEGALNTGAFTTFRDNIVGAMKDLANFISKGEGSPQRIVDKIVGAFTQLGNAKSAAGQSIAKAFTRLGLALKKLFTFVYDKYIEPTLTKMFTGIGKWLDENKFKIAGFIWPVLKWILIWSVTKAVVGAAIGKLLAVLAAKFVAWGTVTGASTGAATSFSFIAAMQGLKAAVMRILASIPIVGWAIMAGAAVVGGIMKGVDQYEKTGSLQKGMKGFAGGIVEMVTFGLVEGDTADKVGNYLTFGIWSGYGKAFDELRNTGSLLEAGKGFIAGVIDGITFGLVSDKSVMNAMHDVFGRTVKDPLEQNYYDLKHHSSYISRELNKDAMAVYEASSGYLKYVQSMKEARSEAAKTGKMLGLQDAGFQARQEQRVNLMNEEAKKAKELADKSVHHAKMRQENSDLGIAGQYVNHDMYGIGMGLTYKEFTSDMTEGLYNQLTSDELRKDLNAAADKGMKYLKKHGYSKEQQGLYIQAMQQIKTGGFKEGMDMDDFLELPQFDGISKENKQFLTTNITKTLSEFNQANQRLSKGYAKQVKALGFMEDGTTAIGGFGAMAGNKLFNMLTEEYRGNARGFYQEADLMEQHLRILKEKNDEKYAGVVKMGFDKARRKYKGLTQQKYDEIVEAENKLKAFQDKMRARVVADNRDSIEKLIQAQYKATTVGVTDEEALKNAKARADKMVVDAILSGDFSGLDKSLQATARGIVSKSDRSFKVTDKQKEKLEALEAANRQVQRLEALKDIPTRLKKLQASLAGWDEKKTTAVATRLFTKVGKVVAAINKAAKDPKVGLDKVETIISASAIAGVESISKFVKQINQAMNVKMFTQKQADDMIQRTVYAMKELPKLGGDHVGKMVTAVTDIRDAINIIPDYIRFVGSVKKKRGLVYLLHDINSNYRTFASFAKKSKKVNEAMGADHSSGLLGVVSSFGDITRELPSDTINLPDGYIESMTTTMSDLALGVDKFAQSIEKIDIATFGKAGTVSSVVSSFVENFNNIREKLGKAANDAKEQGLQVMLNNFAEAMSVSSATFSVKNEPLVFQINVNVLLDTDKLSDSLADETIRFKVVERKESTNTRGSIGEVRAKNGLSRNPSSYTPVGNR